MAQSQNNLVVGIVTDSSKAKADLKLFSAEIQKFTKDLNAAVKAGNQAAAATAHQSLQQSIRQYDQLNAAIKLKTRATEQDVQANRREALSLREVGEQTERLLKVFGLHAEVLKGLKFGFAGLVGAGVIRSLNEVVSRFQEIRKLGSESGFGTQTTQVLQEGFKQAHVAADDANASIGKLGDAFREAQQSVLESGGRVGGQIQLITGKTKDATSEITNFGRAGTEVFHGTTRQAVDFKEQLNALHVDITKFPNTEQCTLGFLKATQLGFENLIKSGRTAEADIRARRLSGLPLQDLMAGLTTSIRDYEKIVEDLRKQGVLFSPADKARLDAYTKAVNTLKTAFEGLQQQITLTVLPDLTEWLNRLNKEVEEHGVKNLWEEFLGKKDYDAVLYLMTNGYQDFVKAVHAADVWLKTTHDKLWQGIGAGARALTQPGPGAVTDQGFATGGYIRGSGTGTSDSIPARLSNGEFVLNAASVRRLGIGYLDALNNFAAGGLVSAPPIRFADGGLVDDFDPSRYDFDPDKPIRRYQSARETPLRVDARETPLGGSARETPLGGSARETPLRVDPRETPLGGYDTSRTATPIHLHIGGGEYPLSTSAAVARKLVAAARREQTASAGTMPSWYGG
jgi:hypothetical protein